MHFTEKRLPSPSSLATVIFFHFKPEGQRIEGHPSDRGLAAKDRLALMQDQGFEGWRNNQEADQDIGREGKQEPEEEAPQGAGCHREWSREMPT